MSFKYVRHFKFMGTHQLDFSMKIMKTTTSESDHLINRFQKLAKTNVVFSIFIQKSIYF